MVLSSNSFEESANSKIELVTFDKSKLIKLDNSLNEIISTTTDKSEAPNSIIPDKKLRCRQCNCKINITNSLECKCKKIFCMKHRYHTEHNCSYDYKTEEIKKLAEANKQIVSDKIIKI